MRAVLLAVSAWALAAGCTFRGAQVGGEGEVDATPDADERSCAFEVPNFDPCMQAPIAPLIISGEFGYDTDTLELKSTETTRTIGVLLEGLDRPAVLLFAESIEIQNGASLRVSGQAPLILASASSISIAGVVSASALLDAPGPGAHEPACAVSGPVVGEDDSGGSGGGGGGGFGGAGGRGNDGDFGTGGQGQGGQGGAVIANPGLFGGCPGARGGDGGGGGDPGPAGGGGGAIQVSARDDLRVRSTGMIDAGGGGGAGASGDDSGGSGGGSGGLIWLTGAEIFLENGAAITANGGGGGGGAGGGSGTAGENGATGDQPAPGGDGASQGGQGDGGVGGAGGVCDGQSAGDTPDGAGGGGGGGCGFIFSNLPLNPSAGVVVSPAATVRNEGAPLSTRATFRGDE